MVLQIALCRIIIVKNIQREGVKQMTALETVKDILSKQLRVDIDSITEDTNIMEDLGADSLDIVEMLMNIEQDYGIVIADDDIVGFKTVGDIVRYIEINQ